MTTENATTPPTNNTGKITLQTAGFPITAERSSPVTKIGGFKWRFTISKSANNSSKDGGNKFDANIFCEPDNDGNATAIVVETLWMCKARVKAWGKRGDFPFTRECFFFNGHTCQKWTEVLSPYVYNTVDVLEMDVCVEWHSLKLSMPTLQTDLVLLFDGREERVAVNKFALASFSTYFRNLFFGNWSERAGDEPGKEKDKFTIKEDPDFYLPAFKLMLYSAMAMGCMVQEGKFLRARMALHILKLSIKYDVPMLQDPTTDCPKMELLNVAEQLGLQQLKDHCLATITGADVVENFGRNADIGARLGKRTRELLEERLNESAKKMRQQQAPAVNNESPGPRNAVRFQQAPAVNNSAGPGPRNAVPRNWAGRSAFGPRYYFGEAPAREPAPDPALIDAFDASNRERLRRARSPAVEDPPADE